MSADVVCMSLANVPPGEQRSRFLAVGLVDNTVRIISLDPSVSGILRVGAGLSTWLPESVPYAATTYHISL